MRHEPQREKERDTWHRCDCQLATCKENVDLVRPITPPQMRKPKKQMGIAWRAVNPIPITVEMVDHRGGANISLHPNPRQRYVHKIVTVVEEVQRSPSPVFYWNRVKIPITPAWIGGITSGRRTELPTERLMFGESKPRTILESRKGAHTVQVPVAPKVEIRI